VTAVGIGTDASGEFAALTGRLVSVALLPDLRRSSRSGSTKETKDGTHAEQQRNHKVTFSHSPHE